MAMVPLKHLPVLCLAESRWYCARSISSEDPYSGPLPTLHLQGSPVQEHLFSELGEMSISPGQEENVVSWISRGENSRGCIWSQWADIAFP